MPLIETRPQWTLHRITLCNSLRFSRSSFVNCLIHY